jgi:hypothetical protein
MFGLNNSIASAHPTTPTPDRTRRLAFLLAENAAGTAKAKQAKNKADPV